MDSTQRQAIIERTFFTRRFQWEILPADPHGATCVEQLRVRLPHIDSESWEARFALGGVFLSRIPATMVTPVVPPCTLEYFDPVFNPLRASEFFPGFTEEMVLYADDDLAVVFKPAGLPSTPPRDIANYNLQAYVSRHFNRPAHLPSRLDVAVSGLMIVSLSERTNRYLQKAQARRWIEKYYVAVVSGVPSWDEKDINEPLGRDPVHPFLKAVRHDNGISARTRVRVLRVLDNESGAKETLIQAEPITGRTHQIRVHCAAEGSPIVGDPYYGDGEGEVHLCSFALRFFHPYLRTELTFSIPTSLWPSWLRRVIEHGYSRALDLANLIRFRKGEL